LDCLKSFLGNAKGDGEIDTALRDQTLDRLGDFLPTSPQGEQSVVVQDSKSMSINPSLGATPGATGFLLTLRFDPRILLDGGDPLILLEQLSEVGTTITIAHTTAVPGLEDIDPRHLYLWWSVKLVTSLRMEEIEEILVFYRDKNDLTIEPVHLPPDEPAPIEAILTTRPIIGQRLTPGTVEEEVAATPALAPVSKTGESQLAEATLVKTSERPVATQTIRVNVDKLDDLQNLVSETVINQSRLKRLGEEIMAADEHLGDMLLQFLEDSEDCVRTLQDRIQQVRMVQLGTLFAPLKRVVRDYAVQEGKQILLQVSGEDTDLDKTVTDQLYGPLLHLVRNAMDHGIEAPQVRQDRGKKPQGTISLSASHQEGFVIVEVSDDGKGLNPDAIRASAVERGLILEDDNLSEREIFQLIFKPGFTTTSEVTSVSGRGVGMDTVQRDIQALLGNIEMDSTPGEGTQLRLKLPLTLAIIEGMIVRVGDQIFTLPLLSIIEALRPEPEQVKQLKRKSELVDIRGEFVPLIRLYERLNIVTSIRRPSDGLVVVVQHGNRKHALMVDEIVDQRPVVIKNLEDNFIQVPGLSGATILGDGSISFILDIPSLAA
jgi:two-component system chemotaxis sensor kinase CheA